MPDLILPTNLIEPPVQPVASAVVPTDVVTQVNSAKQATPATSTAPVLQKVQENKDFGMQMSPTFGLQQLGTQINLQEQDITTDTKKVKDDRSVLITDFIDKIKSGSVAIGDYKMIPTYDVLSQDQKLALTTFKTENGFGNLKSDNPGALLNAIRVKSQAALNSYYTPSYLKDYTNSDSFNQYGDDTELTSEGISNIYSGKVSEFWNKNKNTKGIENPDFPGELNGQCVSLVVNFIKNGLGKKVGTTGQNEYGTYGASGLFTNFGKAGLGFNPKEFDRFEKGKTKYQIGDVVVWPASKSNPYGHVAVVTSNQDAKGNFKVMESNIVGPTASSPVQNGRVINVDSTLGVIRTKEAVQSASQARAKPQAKPQGGGIPSGRTSMDTNYGDVLAQAKSNPVANTIYNYFVPKYGDEVAKKFVVLGKLEGGWRDAAAATVGEQSFGTLQINLDVHNGKVAKYTGTADINTNRKWLANTVNSLKIAEEIYKSSGFSPWTAANKSISTVQGQLGNGKFNF